MGLAVAVFPMTAVLGQVAQDTVLNATPNPVAAAMHTHTSFRPVPIAVAGSVNLLTHLATPAGSRSAGELGLAVMLWWLDAKVIVVHLVRLYDRTTPMPEPWKGTT